MGSRLGLGRHKAYFFGLSLHRHRSNFADSKNTTAKRNGHKHCMCAAAVECQIELFMTKYLNGLQTTSVHEHGNCLHV